MTAHIRLQQESSVPTPPVGFVAIRAASGLLYVKDSAGLERGPMGLLHNMAATTDPGTGDDSADGYAIGSFWYNTILGRLFLCRSATAGAAVWSQVFPAVPKVATYSAADTTPSVRDASYMHVANASPTTITTLDDGANGQVITLHFADANTTIARGATVKLAGGADFTSAADATLQLVLVSTVWCEIARETPS